MINTSRLIRIGQAKIKDQQAWLEGVSLQQSSNQTIAQLRCRVVVARLALAKEMLAQSGHAQRSPRPMHRLTISRSYYCMYHAMRSAAYIYFGGDDYQPHAELPQKIPTDFPDHQSWGNQLKSAREYRNQADYDPYPKSERYWRSIASSVATDAENLVPIVVVYLRTKGCRI